MKITWIVLAIMATCGALADSKVPAPTPSKATAQPKSSAPDNQQQPATDKRATKESPAIIEITKAPVIQVETTDKTEKHNDYASAEWGLVYGTVILVFLTGALALYTAKLFKATKRLAEDANTTGDRQATEMQQSLAIAKQAAEAAKESADVAKFQVEEGRQARILQHRPRLHVRNIVLKEPKFQIGSPIRGQFYVSNVGGVRAHISESHCEILWNVNGLPMERPYEGKNGNNPLPGSPTIQAGSSSVGLFMSEAIWQGKGTPGDIGIGGVRIYVLGWIEYFDDIAIKRRLAFCRQFLQREGSARFYPTNDPDYEYEE